MGGKLMISKLASNKVQHGLLRFAKTTQYSFT